MKEFELLKAWDALNAQEKKSICFLWCKENPFIGSFTTFCVAIGYKKPDIPNVLALKKLAKRKIIIIEKQKKGYRFYLPMQWKENLIISVTAE